MFFIWIILAFTFIIPIVINLLVIRFLRKWARGLALFILLMMPVFISFYLQSPYYMDNPEGNQAGEALWYLMIWTFAFTAFLSALISLLILLFSKRRRV